MGDKFENVTAHGAGIAIGRGARAHGSHSEGNVELAEALRTLAELVGRSGHDDSAVEKACFEQAAAAADKGDDKTVIGFLKKAGSWTFDLAKTTGSSVLSAYLKTHLGLP